jgi:pilus assembly protein CpaE
VLPVTAGLIIETKALWDELQECLQNLPVRVILEQPGTGDIGALIDKIERMRLNVVFVDLVNQDLVLKDLVPRIKALPGAPAIIALHTIADADAILSSLRAGVQEFLYPPLTDHLGPALERVRSEAQKQSASVTRGGKVLGFVSAKGGCGATTIACHVAAELGRRPGLKTLLADLDLDSGMVGFVMKSKSAYTIIDAIANTHRLDYSYWKALVSNGMGNLEVIAAPPGGASAHFAKPEQVKYVLSFCRNEYDWLVLDLGRSLNTVSLAVLGELNELFLVTSVEVPALHQARLVAQNASASGIPANRIHLVLNRASKNSDVTVPEVEQALGTSVYITIPNDYSALQDAYAEGRLLMPNCGLAKRYAEFVDRLLGVQPPRHKGFSIRLRTKPLSLFG